MKAHATPERSDLRFDLGVIADLVPAGSRMLDIGCGDGALMTFLRDTKGVDARGIELDMEKVAGAVARGASVIHGDAETDLQNYPTGSFDVVVLSQTLQAMHRPEQVLRQLLRIGRQAIVSVPNFAHWRARISLALGGRMPMTRALPVSWYETDNIHFCTIADFQELCRARGVAVDQALYFAGQPPRRVTLLPNLLADQAIFQLRQAD